MTFFPVLQENVTNLALTSLLFQAGAKCLIDLMVGLKTQGSQPLSSMSSTCGGYGFDFEQD